MNEVPTSELREKLNNSFSFDCRNYVKEKWLSKYYKILNLIILTRFFLCSSLIFLFWSSRPCSDWELWLSNKGLIQLGENKVFLYSSLSFLVVDTQLYKRLCPSIHLLVHLSVMVIESESVKTRISAPAHPSATSIGRVSGLVFLVLNGINKLMCWCEHANIRKHVSEHSWLSGLVIYWFEI